MRTHSFHLKQIVLLVLFAWGVSFAQAKYTAFNWWYVKPNKVQAINFKTGKILPAGTRVTNIKIQKGRRPAITFTVVETGEKFVISFNKKYHGKVSIDTFFGRIFTDKTFEENTADLTPDEIKGIRLGKIRPGMSKKAVILSLGLPPEHKTPTLRKNTWIYWRSRSRKFVVNFDAEGKVLPRGKKAARKPTPVLANRPSRKPDTTPPSIVITEPAVTRGMRMTSKKIIVRGKATDESGVFEVLVNGADAHLSADGSFWAEVLLAVGENQIHVRARDTKNNVQDQTFTIVRDGGEAAAPTVADHLQDKIQLGSGKYYALIIAVEDYASRSIRDLDEPVQDAIEIQNILTSKYTFEPQNVILLKNPTRDQIIEHFDQLSRKIRKEDNLLIFYAGHGYWDEKFQQGYWLPSDAIRENRTKWISNSTIVDFIRGIETTHTLLITDACFSGGIFKTRKAFDDAPAAVSQLYKLPSRKAMTSGTLKEVPDKSVFVEYLTKRLKGNTEKYLSSEQLFTSFRTAVINNSPINQIPQYGEIRQTGDEGGDFIFIKK